MTAQPVELSYEIIAGPSPATHQFPVIFIGALGSNKSMWLAQHEAISAEFTACYCDKRGHGASPVPAGPYSVAAMAADITAVMDANNWAKAHIVGLSLGGAVAQMVAITAPERVVSLTLVSTATKFGDRPTWLEKAAKVRAESTAAIAMDSATRWFTPDYGISSGKRDEFYAMVSACPDEGYAGSCEALAEFDSAADLAQVTAPTLVISGAQDPGTTPAVVRQVHAAIAGSTFASLEPAAHLCNIEQAEQFNHLVLTHLHAADQAAAEQQ
ncbi:alpha/beta fold hydrolase [Corynebacterium choanae]|uniref:3-oxoadipate enol-lactonase 2 n=1 Tax=Corynebacterium choanae TaxID=1862358 RepID=A0A3G6J5C2_9CORY|nr:alpha/beta fold hydrolase [Corynebacterium choanae]AZA13166.1 3-oxoadipate enol-lactonase 2 [Corynebacterium choanae]